MEIYGFKSFAEKTKLEFSQGITAIVGPNGSGKSNLSDAIRWALGEQSARQLRGSKMEDIIFGGSSGKRALGMSEVSLCFDNQEGILPIDFNEVTVTRRIFRSGESEYLLNNSPCRLRDIYDLFAGTGVGRETYATIEQGKIDLISSTRPEDRRVIFEEAAGILKHKNKKREALNKLADTAQKIVRLEDLLREIDNQLIPLDGARKKTVRYQEYNRQLEALEQQLTLDSWANLQAKQNAYQDQEKDYQKKLKELQNLQKELETDLEQMVNLLEKIKVNLEEVQEEYHGILSKIDLLEMEIKVGLEREGENLERQIEQTKKQESLEAVLGQVQQEISDQQKALEQLTIKLELLDSQEKEHDAALIKEQENLKEKGKHLNYLKSELIEILNLRAKKQYELKNLDDTRQSITKKKVSLSEEKQIIIRKKANLEEEKTRLAKLKKENTENLTLTQLEIGDLKETNAQKNKEHKKEANLIYQLEKNLESKQSRLNLLLEMENSLEGYARGVKAVLTASRKNPALGQGICGTVAELIRVPEKYERAIEVALGQALQNIVTETEKKGQQLIEYLKETRAGRATFLPLNIIQGSKYKFEHLPGSLGLGVELIEFAPQYQPIMDYLLGRIVVAEGLDSALRISKKLNYRLRIVTLDGDVINPGGAMTGGSWGGKQLGLLGRIREKEELSQFITNTKQELLEKVKKQQEQEDELKSLGEVIEGKERQLDYWKSLLENWEKDWLEIEKEEKKLIQEEELLLWETQQLEKERELLVSQAKTERDNFNSLEKNKEKLEQEINLSQKDLEEKARLLDKIKDAVTGLKINNAAFIQEKANREFNKVKLAERLAELKQENDLSKQESSRLEVQIQVISKDISQKKEELQKCLDKKEELAIQLDKLKMEEEGLKNAFKEKEKRKKYLDKAISHLEKEWSQIAVLKGRVEAELSYQLEQLKVRFSMDAPQDIAGFILEDSKRTQIIEEAQHQGEQIKNLGPVNLGAIEEYQNLKNRYDFLKDQYQDLLSGKKSLEQLLIEIDEIMKKRFLENFSKIQEEFKVVYQRLFNGGKAQLSLCDPQRVLETGIDIIVQPPGKKFQNLSLLSGGEKALTAVALLFSILKVNPSPFCLLDEIDAALDDANVKRVADLLKELGEKIQFIIITHRKGTMEMADCLYGVTMEESGISRLISVKLTERAS